MEWTVATIRRNIPTGSIKKVLSRMENVGYAREIYEAGMGNNAQTID